MHGIIDEDPQELSSTEVQDWGLKVARLVEVLAEARATFEHEETRVDFTESRNSPASTASLSEILVRDCLEKLSALVQSVTAL